MRHIKVKNQFFRDYRFRQKLQAVQIKLFFLKFFIKYLSSDIQNKSFDIYKYKHIKILLKLRKIYFRNVFQLKHGYNNYCVITGRKRGVFSKYQLSRIKLKEFIEDGKLLGFKEAS